MKILSILAALLLGGLPAVAQDKINSPAFQGAARTDLNMGGHAVSNAGTLSVGAGSAVIAVSASSGSLIATGPGGTGIIAMSLTGQAFVFEGDSITAGFNATHPFSYYAASLPFFSGHGTIYNSAVTASQIPAGSNGGNNITDRYNTYVKPHRPAANGGDGGPRAFLFLMIGTNDIGNAGRTGAQVITDLTNYVSTAHADGITVVLSTLTPRNDGGWSSTKEGYRQQVNAAIRAGTIGADLILDYAAQLPNPNNATIYGDALHPTDAGQKALAQYLNGFMQVGGGFTVTNGSFAEQILNAPQVAVAGPSNLNGGLSVAGSFNWTGLSMELRTDNAGPGGATRGQVAVFDRASPSYRVLDLNDTMRVTGDTSGRVMIGTKTDDGVHKLQVAGSVSGGTAFFDGGTDANYIQSGMSPSNATSYPLVVKNTSATGITAIDFLDNLNTQRGTIGYGAASSPFYANVGLWLSHDPVYFCDAGLGNWAMFDFPNHKVRFGDDHAPTEVLESSANIKAVGNVIAAGFSGSGASLTGITVSALSSSGASSGYVPTANGSGGVTWAAQSGGGGSGGAGIPPAPGSFRNLVGSAPGSTKTASWACEYLVAATAIGGTCYTNSSALTTATLSFSGSTTGAGGMDTGSTPTSGNLYVYAIYNPTSSTWKTLGTTTGSGATIYAGSNMPSGYTASCLIWAGVTDASGNVQKFNQQDRYIFFPRIAVLNISSGSSTTYTSFSLSAAVPIGAKMVFGNAGYSSSSGDYTYSLAADSSGTAALTLGWGNSTGTLDSFYGGGVAFSMPVVTSQTLYYKQQTAGNMYVVISGFTF